MRKKRDNNGGRHDTNVFQGYPMAKNLRTKIPASDTMVIHDVNPTILEQFKAEHNNNVTIAKDVREVSENTVCCEKVKLTIIGR